MKKLIATIALLLMGCTTNVAAPGEYALVKDQVRLGMSRPAFNKIMKPVSDKTLPASRRNDETYTEDGDIVDIVYVRSGWVSDGIQTDDEYTPYVFRDGILVAFGWRAIGGMKFTSADLIKAEAKATKVNVSTTVNNNTNKPIIKPICLPGSPLKTSGC
jgi:hypothetical protein